MASVVGLVCIKIFGYRDPAAEQLAERCGLAFQLTNIIRDVKEDAARAASISPQEDLAKFGISPAELRRLDAARFEPLLTMEADRAREYYRVRRRVDSSTLMKTASPRYGRSSRSTSRLLEKIAVRQYDVFHRQGPA